MDSAISFKFETCIQCSIPFYMPSYHYNKLISNPGDAFYCPNGHKMHYSGKSEAALLKLRISELEQENNRQNTLLNNAIRERRELLDRIKENKKQICPCCNKKFINLITHIKNKHPDYSSKA